MEVITVARIERPGEGKKQGKLIDTNGKKWGVWADKLGNYHEGGTYQIQKIKTSEFRGTSYVTIEAAMPVPGPANVPQHAGQSRAGESDAERQINIFVCGGFNNMMANPNVNPAMLSDRDLAKWVQRLRMAWIDGNKNNDLNDDIPDFK